MMIVTYRPLPLLFVLAALALGVLALRPELADAQRGGRAAAYVVQTQVPRNMETRALLRFGRSHAARRLQETTGGPINERIWLAKLIINFGRPLGDVQYDVLYYDVTQGRTLVTTQEVFVNDRTQQAFVNPIRLRRPQFSPGQRIEVPRSSGVVDFTAGGDATP
jgi:hypothetical protein